LLAITAAPRTAQAQTVRAAEWYLDFLHVPQAQQISTGAGVTVAVVDSGVDASHPDLSGRVMAGKSFGSAVAQPSTEDTVGHGTAMAGIIAAQGGGAHHALGIAPRASILSVRSSATSHSDPDDVAKAIRWATDHGADVINVSQAANTSTPEEVSAVHYAEVHDVLIVAGAGNTNVGVTSVGAPGRLKGVLNVTGVDQSGKFWNGSAQGKYATLSAPAVKIVSPTSIGRTGYAQGTGTSAATAIVSGVAAMVRAKYPDMDAANVINRIIKTATDRGPTGWDQQYGFGIVNPVAALTANVPTVHKNPLGGTVADPLASSAPPQGADGVSRPAAAGSGAGTGPALIAVVVAVVLVVLVAVIVVMMMRNRRRNGRAADSGPTGGSVLPPANRR